MKFYISLILFILSTTLLCAQALDRVEVQGKITAPAGEPVDGIHIFNKATFQGAITNEDGTFAIQVAANDRLIISAIQFVEFTAIVDEGVIASKQLNIYMNPAINRLDEVVVRPYDLSGNIRVDVGKIKTIAINSDFDISYETLEFGYEFAPDAQTAIQGNYAEEVFYNGQSQNGGNIIGLAALIVNSLLPKTKKKEKKTARQIENEQNQIMSGLKGMFSEQQLFDLYAIPLDKTNEFLYFVEDQGFPKQYLQPENQLQLLAFMKDKSALFLARIEN